MAASAQDPPTVEPSAITAMIQGVWDGLSPAYNRFVDERMMAPAASLVVAAVKGYWADRTPRHGGHFSVLDLAGGPGWPAIPLARAVPTARVTCTDLSPAMAEFAAQRVEDAGLSDRVSARQADMQDLSAWQDASLDVVTCQYGLSFAPNVAAAMTESARVLRPGGLYVAVVNGVKLQQVELVMEVAKQLDLPVPPYQVSVERLKDVGKTTADLEAAGFTSVHAKPFMHSHVWDRKEDLAGLTTAVLRPTIGKAQASGRLITDDEVTQACLDAIKRLHFAFEYSKGCATNNEAFMYTAIKR